MDEREALVALNMVPKIGPIRVRNLLEAFGEATAILKAPASQLRRVEGIGEDVANSICQWEKKVDLSSELKRIEEYDCRILIQTDDEYPKLLREIYDPPIVLYVKGKLIDRDHQGIAIVGSRMTTNYGTETARKLAYQLAYSGITVISGGARGIDTFSHQGALAAKGRTIAVLGNGINIVYPSDNADLFERICENGAVITQFPFNRKGDKQSFPIRNRIVAGMTLGTVVVEANLASGALITANMAADNNRTVFAVPGRIDSPRSKGCHDLIKKGAVLCDGVEDILQEFETLFPNASQQSASETSPVIATDLNENEQTVFDALSGEEKQIDDIIFETGLPSPTVSVVLLKLEMKKLVKQLPGKRFTLNR